MKTLWAFFKSNGVALVVFAALLVITLVGVADAERGSRGESLRLLEQSVRRAAVTCYAAEGRYPADLEYLRANYGLRIDQDKYFVDYTAFSSNLMPDVTVLLR